MSEFDISIREAIKSFWSFRAMRGVRTGQTLDGIVSLLKHIIVAEGMADVDFLDGRKALVPGFYRASKNWDLLVLYKGVLIAAIELKSIADSAGKNVNNRAEEVVGSGVDLHEAIVEGAVNCVSRLFTGYLILVEDCEDTRKSVRIMMRHFLAMNDFILDTDIDFDKDESGLYPTLQGVSKIKRFEILCDRLMRKKVYSAASLILTPRTAVADGEYSCVSKATSIEIFITTLIGHIRTARIELDS